MLNQLGVLPPELREKGLHMHYRLSGELRESEKRLTVFFLQETSKLRLPDLSILVTADDELILGQVQVCDVQAVVLEMQVAGTFYAQQLRITVTVHAILKTYTCRCPL